MLRHAAVELLQKDIQQFLSRQSVYRDCREQVTDDVQSRCAAFQAAGRGGGSSEDAETRSLVCSVKVSM